MSMAVAVPRLLPIDGEAGLDCDGVEDSFQGFVESLVDALEFIGEERGIIDDPGPEGGFDGGFGPEVGEGLDLDGEAGGQLYGTVGSGLEFLLCVVFDGVAGPGPSAEALDGEVAGDVEGIGNLKDLCGGGIDDVAVAVFEVLSEAMLGELVGILTNPFLEALAAVDDELGPVVLPGVGFGAAVVEDGFDFVAAAAAGDVDAGFGGFEPFEVFAKGIGGGEGEDGLLTQGGREEVLEALDSVRDGVVDEGMALELVLGGFGEGSGEEANGGFGGCCGDFIDHGRRWLGVTGWGGGIIGERL